MLRTFCLLCRAEEICRPETASQLPTQNQHTSPELTTPSACAELELRVQSEQRFSQDLHYCFLGG